MYYYYLKNHFDKLSEIDKKDWDALINLIFSNVDET